MQPADTRLSLDDTGINRVQGILGALLYVGRAVNNKLLVALSVIESQKAAATVETEDVIEQLLEYQGALGPMGLYGPIATLWNRGADQLKFPADQLKLHGCVHFTKETCVCSFKMSKKWSEMTHDQLWPQGAHV